MCLLGPYEIDFSDGGIVVVDFNFFASRSKEFPIDASFIFPGRDGEEPRCTARIGLTAGHHGPVMLIRLVVFSG
jgi:hypothetical protein